MEGVDYHIKSEFYDFIAEFNGIIFISIVMFSCLVIRSADY